MTWLAFRVEVHTTDGRDDTAERIQREVLRALEYRFSAVTCELAEVVPEFAEGGCIPAARAVVVPAGTTVHPAKRDG